MSEVIKLHLTWPSRLNGLAAVEALIGENVEAWPPTGEFVLDPASPPIRYSAVEFPPIVDDAGEIVAGFHVGVWLYASPEQLTLVQSLGATVRLEPDLPDWWPRLG